MELLRELLPSLSRVAFLAHGANPVYRIFVQEAQDAAARLGMQMQPVVIGSLEELDSAFAAMHSERAEALLVQPLFMVVLGQGQKIVDLAATHRLPTISEGNQFAEDGGLLFYGPDRLAQLWRSVIFVDKILKAPSRATSP